MRKTTHAAPSTEPGRPRNPETERRILNEALRLLAAQGYSRMSLDGVAEAAGVSKPTIYRRWSSKADLATAAVRSLQLSEPPVETGFTKSDLVATMTNFTRSLLRPNGMSLIGTVLAEEEHTPELLRFFRERIVAPRRDMLRAILDRAAARGELREGAQIDCAVNALVGAIYARYLAGPGIPHSFVADLIDTLWTGIAATPES